MGVSETDARHTLLASAHFIGHRSHRWLFFSALDCARARLRAHLRSARLVRSLGSSARLGRRNDRRAGLRWRWPQELSQLASARHRCALCLRSRSHTSIRVELRLLLELSSSDSRSKVALKAVSDFVGFFELKLPSSKSLLGCSGSPVLSLCSTECYG